MDTNHDEIRHPSPAPGTSGALADRRAFLKVGGLTAGLAAVAAACVYPDKPVEKMAQTGTIVAPPTTTKAPNPGSSLLDATLTLTALSVERLAIDVYDEILQKAWIGSGTVTDIVKTIRDHHAQHADLLAGLAAGQGQDAAAATSNAAVKTSLIDPAIETLMATIDDKKKTEDNAVITAIDIEDALAQLYAKAGGTMTTADLRARMMSIGGATARQYSVLAGAIGRPYAPFAFQPSASPSVPVAAYVQADEKTLKASPGTSVAGTTTTTKKS